MSFGLQSWLHATGGAGPDAPENALLPGLPGADRRLRAVIAAAADFEERAAARDDGRALFAPDPAEDRPGRAAAVESWLRRAAGDPGAAGVLLDHLARTGRPLGAGLRRVRLADPARLPAWAYPLAVFLRAQADAPDTGPGAITAGFRAAADALLPAGPGTVLGVEVTGRGRADVLGTLAGRLTEAADLTLRQESRTADRPTREPVWDAAGGPDASAAGWLARLERLPALARLIGTVCGQWQEAYTEMFARLAADRAGLVEQLWHGTDPGPLDSVRGDAGTRYARGRAVALLRFADGRGAVYKPKDLRHATAFLGLVERLNRELSLDLPLRTVLPRSDRGDDGLAASLYTDGAGDYGWEELVPSRPCADRAGLARFHRRLGMTIRLVQLLEGRAPWADNLLADGEHPVLIGLDCLLPPSVPVPMTVPGVPGVPVADPWPYTGELVEGYREMQAVLCRLRGELADPGGPLSGFRGIWVRSVRRSARDGRTLLRDSTGPLALADGTTRETVLAAALRGGPPEAALAELDSHRTLDLPFFRSLTTSAAVFTADGREIPGPVRPTGWQRLRQRVAALDGFDLEAHVAALAKCADAARTHADAPPVGT